MDPPSGGHGGRLSSSPQHADGPIGTFHIRTTSIGTTDTATKESSGYSRAASGPNSNHTNPIPILFHIYRKPNNCPSIFVSKYPTIVIPISSWNARPERLKQLEQRHSHVKLIHQILLIVLEINVRMKINSESAGIMAKTPMLDL
jgi:hypothetical protein